MIDPTVVVNRGNGRASLARHGDRRSHVILSGNRKKVSRRMSAAAATIDRLRPTAIATGKIAAAAATGVVSTSALPGALVTGNGFGAHPRFLKFSDALALFAAL
jgi:hypothetical protein